jgi:hypothetical protein
MKKEIVSRNILGFFGWVLMCTTDITVTLPFVRALFSEPRPTSPPASKDYSVASGTNIMASGGHGVALGGYSVASTDRSTASKDRSV